MTPAPVEILIPAQEIASRMKSLARDILDQLPPDVLIVSLLRGSFVFTSDLIRAMHLADSKHSFKPQIDFMTLASYGRGTTTSGKVEIVRDLTEDVKGRDVLIVDDILESGLTLQFARDLILSRGAKSARIAVLLEKPGKRKTDISADYVGFVIADKFVVGYGLDYANYYRELPFIGALSP